MIPKNEELREALGLLEKQIENPIVGIGNFMCNPNLVKSVISVLRNLLNTPEGWPEEIEYPSINYHKGYNFAVNKCNKARLKEKPTVKELQAAIDKHMEEVTGIKAKDVYPEGSKRTLGLAEVIYKLKGGG